MARQINPTVKQLNERHELFVIEYLKDRNGARAYRAAGFQAASPRQEAWVLLRDPLIAARIAELSKEKFQALHMEVDEILARAAMIARASLGPLVDEHGQFRPIHELDETAAACIAGIEVDELFVGAGEDRRPVGMTRKVRLRDPMPALKLLAEHKKLIGSADALNSIATALAERMKAAREARKLKEQTP